MVDEEGKEDEDKVEFDSAGEALDRHFTLDEALVPWLQETFDAIEPLKPELAQAKRNIDIASCYRAPKTVRASCKLAWRSVAPEKMVRKSSVPTVR